jgi:hypothetical protein
MAETIGLLILDAAGATAAGSGIAGLGTLAGTTISIGAASISLATVVGTAAILGATIGLNYALRPSLPKPEDGSQAIKQAIPPRIRGYGTNRLAGYYMLFEAAGNPPASSYDVMAFHSGRISEISGLYLHDDPVTTSPSILPGAVIGSVASTYADGRYAGWVFLEAALGAPVQFAPSLMTDSPAIADVWTSAHRGNGIAWIAMKCVCPGQVPDFTKVYPHQLPLLSVVAQCSPVWDPRDPAQHRDDESTWVISYNPVTQLIDYLTRVDGGMGLDYDTVIAPNIVAWTNEIDLCDQQVATSVPGVTEARYRSHGWFQFDNKPEDVIGGLLSTCDGWLAESGDGTLSITVGVYRAPSDPPLTDRHIFGFALNYGQPDEQTVNQLEISFTDPSANYVQVQIDPSRQEDAISLTGVVRSQSLDLKWVQSSSQARRLASRALYRLNPAMTGSFTTSLYGLRYLGKRWVPLQYPFVSGLQDCVVEIQAAEIDLMAGRIVWNFITIAGATIEAYNPATDEGAKPVVLPPVAKGTALDFSYATDSQYLALLEDI